MSDTTDATLDSPQTSPGVPGRTIFGHPIGLANLFGVEMWERFSFYGMLTILGAYLVDDLGLPKATALGIVGAYGAFAYLCTVPGGWLADRVLGMERTIFYGGFVVMLGHIGLAVLPGLSGVGVGLVLVGLGSGALKANASALLGTLYEQGDPRRDGGFTLFYLGVNTGAFIGPLITGLLVGIGYHYGFGAAAIGMALGLIQYGIFRRNLGTHGRRPPNPLPADARLRMISVGVLAVVVIVAILFTGVVTLARLATVIAGAIAVVILVYCMVLLTSKKVTNAERGRVRAYLPLLIANVAFWSLFQQIFTTLQSYSKSRMDWNILGWNAPVSWIGSEEPIWIILLSPVFALTWTRLRDRAPSTPMKFALGTIGMGGAFLLFLLFAGGTGKTTPTLAVLFILAVFAISELLLSPIGLSVTTKLSPELFRSQMMALYFLSVALGTALSGSLAQFYLKVSEYAYFGMNGAVVIVIGLIAMALSPWIRRHMDGVH